MLPVNLIAKENNGNTNEKKEPPLQEVISEKETEATIVEEVIELRERNIKHFRKDDKSFEAVVYASPVHFMKDGKWEQIDNTLVDAVDENKDNVLENKSNDFKVKIASKSDAKNLIRIQKEHYELSWGLEQEKNQKIIQRNKRVI